MSWLGNLYPPAALTDVGFWGWGQGQTAVNYQSDYSFLLTTATEQREDNH